MIVDFHAHFFGKGFVPPAFFTEIAQGWAEKADDRTPEMIMPKLIKGVVDEDGQLYIKNMDLAGVDVTIVNMMDFGVHWCGEDPDVPMEAQIEFYEDLHRRYPERLWFFAFFDPRRENGLELLEKAAKKPGFLGFGEVTPEGFTMEDPIVRPFFMKCMELRMPVFVHTRSGLGEEMIGEDYSLSNPAHPHHIRTLQAAFPELVVILGHAGYDIWWEEACRVARGNPNCYLELSNWHLEISNPAQLIAKLACMRDMVGADHILFGSDQLSGKRFCLERSPLASWVDFFKSLPENARRYGYHFTEEEVQLILGDNALRILRL